MVKNRILIIFIFNLAASELAKMMLDTQVRVKLTGFVAMLQKAGLDTDAAASLFGGWKK